MSTSHEKMPWEPDPPKKGPGKSEALPETDKLAAVSPDYPLKWIDVDQSLWPFTDFKHEYIGSKYLMDAITLARRWAGLVDANEIYAFFLLPDIEDDRWKAQNSYGEIDTPEWRLRWNHSMIRRFEGLMQIAEQKIKTGGEIEKVGGIEALVPHSARKLDSLNKQVMGYFQQIRLLQGESTAIIEKRGGASNNTPLDELMLEGLKNLPPELLAVVMMSLPQMNFPTTASATEGPRVAPSEKSAGQLYEAKPE